MLIIYLWKGKGRRVQDRGKCHYLLSRSLQHEPFLGQLEWGGTPSSPKSGGGGGQGRAQMGAAVARVGRALGR